MAESTGDGESEALDKFASMLAEIKFSYDTGEFPASDAELHRLVSSGALAQDEVDAVKSLSSTLYENISALSSGLQQLRMSAYSRKHTAE